MPIETLGPRGMPHAVSPVEMPLSLFMSSFCCSPTRKGTQRPQNWGYDLACRCRSLILRYSAGMPAVGQKRAYILAVLFPAGPLLKVDLPSGCRSIGSPNPLYPPASLRRYHRSTAFLRSFQSSRLHISQRFPPDIHLASA